MGFLLGLLLTTSIVLIPIMLFLIISELEDTAKKQRAMCEQNKKIITLLYFIAHFDHRYPSCTAEEIEEMLGGDLLKSNRAEQ